MDDGPGRLACSKRSAPEARAGTRAAHGQGNIRNYFERQGPVAVHLLTRSGQDPRIVAAFPAGNQGIGVWFTRVAAVRSSGPVTRRPPTTRMR